MHVPVLNSGEFWIRVKVVKKMAATNHSESTWYVSTGHLPPSELVTTLVAEAYKRFEADTEGKNSAVYPALERVPSDLFGVCRGWHQGTVYAVGDAEYEFTIMSVSKPFVFALVCQELGVEEVRGKNWGERHGFCLQLSGWHRTEP